MLENDEHTTLSDGWKKWLEGLQDAEPPETSASEINENQARTAGSTPIDDVTCRYHAALDSEADKHYERNPSSDAAEIQDLMHITNNTDRPKMQSCKKRTHSYSSVDTSKDLKPPYCKKRCRSRGSGSDEEHDRGQTPCGSENTLSTRESLAIYSSAADAPPFECPQCGEYLAPYIHNPQKSLLCWSFAEFSLTFCSMPCLKRGDVKGDKVFELHRRMQHYAKGESLISKEFLTEDLKEVLASGHPEDDDETIARIIDNTEERNRLGISYSSTAAREIIEIARRLTRDAADGTCWNMTVYRRLLNDICAGSTHSATQTFDTVSSARIHPSELEVVPRKNDVKHLWSRKIDFCLRLTMKNEDSEQRALFQKQILLFCTDESNCLHPIGILVKTKGANEGLAGPNNALATWAVALIKLIRQLLHKTGRDDINIPPIPMLGFIGPVVHLWVIEDENRGKQSARFYDEGIQIGDLSTVLGIYQLSASLQYLMDWVETGYRVWFNENIIDPLMTSLIPGSDDS